jgi:WD40 repeat protein
MRHLGFPDYHYPIIPMFSPCGRWLYARIGAAIVAWDLSKSSSEPAWHDYDSGAFLFNLIVSPCGKYLAGADDRCVVIWDTVKRGEPKWLLANPSGDHISDVAFSPDGKELLTACIDGKGGVRRWRVGNWQRKPAFAMRANCDGALAVSPDGKTVATADAIRKGGMRLKLWNYPQGAHRKTAKHTTEGIWRITYSPDGKWIMTNDDRRRLEVWNARTLDRVTEYVPKIKIKSRRKITEPVHSFAFHPSGRYLVVGGQAGPIEFVDTATWQPVVAFDWKFRSCFGVAFSPDGTLAAAGSDKGQVVVWDADL